MAGVVGDGDEGEFQHAQQDDAFHDGLHPRLRLVSVLLDVQFDVVELVVVAQYASVDVGGLYAESPL